MPARIFPKRLPRLFLAEWREKRKLTQAEAGQRLDPPVSDVTVSRWETGKRRPDINVIAALAEAYGCEFRDMFRHPDQPSADDLLREQPPEVRDNVLRMIRGLKSA